MNYLVIHKPSNTVTGVVTSSKTPTETPSSRFILASDKVLDTFFKLKAKSPDRAVELGQLMLVSDYVRDVVADGKSGTTSILKPRIRY